MHIWDPPIRESQVEETFKILKNQFDTGLSSQIGHYGQPQGVHTGVFRMELSFGWSTSLEYPNSGKITNNYKEPQQYSEMVGQNILKNGCNYFPLYIHTFNYVVSKLLLSKGGPYFPPLNLDWPCDLLWLAGGDIWVPSLGPKGLCTLPFSLWTSIYEKKPGLTCWRMRGHMGQNWPSKNPRYLR